MNDEKIGGISLDDIMAAAMDGLDDVSPNVAPSVPVAPAAPVAPVAPVAPAAPAAPAVVPAAAPAAPSWALPVPVLLKSPAILPP